MAYTYHELKLKTVADLREIARGLSHDAVQGSSQMNKEHLLPALCTALGIDAHEHHTVAGIDKPAIKAKMKALKRTAMPRSRLAIPRATSRRRHIHKLNRQIRAHLQ
jgi:hypothetical protein